MKKLCLILCVIITLPFVLCSCFESEAQSITLSNKELSMLVGDSSELTASISPDDVRDKSITWSSSNENVADISSDGKVKAKGEGSAVITALTKNGVKAECSVKVEPIEVASVKLNSDNVSVYVGKKIEITAKVQPANASDKGLKWSSSDEKIAVVNSSGFVTGVSEGVANITCSTPNGKSASCTVTVKKASSTSKKESSDSSKSESSENEASKNESSKSSSSSERSQKSKKSSDSSGFIFSDSSNRKLKESEVSSLSSEEVQQAINEIYARNGYVFKTDEIQSFFESKSWYSPNPNFSMSDLNETESYNVGLLSRYR